METSIDHLPSTEELRRYRALIGLCAYACESVLIIGGGYRLEQEIQDASALTIEKVKTLSKVETPAALVEMRHTRLLDQYYTLVLGRLVLRSPLRKSLMAIISEGTAAGRRHYDALEAAALDYVAQMVPLMEQWLGEALAHSEHLPAAAPADDVPADDVPALTPWQAGRAKLEAVFEEVGPDLEHFTKTTAHIYEKPSKQPQPVGAPPARRGPFLRRAFTEPELSAVRLLLTYVPDLARLLPNYPLALALQSLSSYQPPDRLAALRTALQPLKPNQPLHLTLDESLTLLQTLHAGALLLLSDTVERVSRQLRKRLAEGETLSDECRTDCSRLLLLLTDAATSQNFRATFGPLLKSFLAAVDRTYPHAPEPKQARAEVAELVALR